MKVVISAVAIVILTIGAQSAYAEQFGHEYYWGHPPTYWKGVDTGTKYAQEHVMVKVIQGHVLTDYGAAKYIVDWFDGQTARTNVEAMSKTASSGYTDGYKAPYGTLPPVVVLVLITLAYAYEVDTNGKPIIMYDSQGRPCTFGPAHDLCQYEFLERIPGTPNNIDYHAGIKVGYTDGLKEGIYHHHTAEDNAPSLSRGDGYTDGWSKGCRDSGRTGDDCDSQEDVSPP